MSWSFSAIGKPAAVVAKIEEAIHNGGRPYCAEPEESIRVAALKTLALAANACVASTVVKATGNGSMYNVVGKGGVNEPQWNNVAIACEPLHGFVE